MKELLEFINKKNKIAYTMHKAYELGFSNSDTDNREKPLTIIKNMQKTLTSSYFYNKISYAEMCSDFMNIIPHLSNENRLIEMFENFKCWLWRKAK